MTLTNRISCLSVAGLLALPAVPALAQSFNCHKAFYADERTICREPGLGHLDSELAALFGHVMSRLPPPQRDALKRRETDWVVARRRCGNDAACIAGFYEQRIRTLDGMSAANEPEGAGRLQRPSLQTRARSEPAHPEPNSAAPPPAQNTLHAQRPVERKRAPRAVASNPAVASPRAPRPAGKAPSSDTAASGSAAPTPVVPPASFEIEPEVSPAGRGGSDASAGGPMTPAH